MKIAVVGSGYVGTTTAAVLASGGFDVVALDVDEEKVKLINAGKAPFFEGGLDNLIQAGIKNKTLSATTNYESAIKDADIVFSSVGTPDNPDGSSNLSYVFSAAKSAAPFLKKGAIYIQKSTVPVGTGRRVIRFLPENVHYVSNPEFLREGTAIYDTLLFDRIVVGGDDDKANQKVIEVYKQVETNKHAVSKNAGNIGKDKLSTHQGEYIATTLESAELIKVTANAFLALKISFANNIAKLCDETNADVNDVMSAVGADKRIGKAFLNAGRGYGGGCFPKDVSGLISSALEFGVDMPIMTASVDVNESMPGYIIHKVEKALGGLSGKNIAVLGLAFKEGTSDARKSPAVKIANLLAKLKAKVTAYDPEANEEATQELVRNVSISSNIKEAVKNAEIIFIATKWDQFVNASNWLPHASKLQTVVDCMNCIDQAIIKGSNIKYIGVGI